MILKNEVVKIPSSMIMNINVKSLKSLYLSIYEIQIISGLWPWILGLDNIECIWTHEKLRMLPSTQYAHSYVSMCS